jgi:hypothetical protein
MTPPGRLLVKNITNLGIVEADDVCRFDPEYDIMATAAIRAVVVCVPRWISFASIPCFVR